MLELVQDLCRSVTTSHCNPPRWSDWSLVDPSQSNISIDLADVASGGGGAIAPVNIKAYGSYFETGLSNSSAGICAAAHGYGAGAGIGAGWGIPFVGARGVGRMPSGIRRALIEKLGGAAQGKAIDMLKGAIDLGVSGGTRLVCGPDAPNGMLRPIDLEGYATIISLGANFVVNGVSVGMIIFSKDRPVIEQEDMIYATAIGLIAGVGLATSLDIEGNGIVYMVRLG